MTHRDHENDTNNEALISRLGVIEEMLINVKQGQRNSSARAKESDDVQQDWSHFAAEFRISVSENRRVVPTEPNS